MKKGFGVGSVIVIIAIILIIVGYIYYSNQPVDTTVDGTTTEDTLPTDGTDTTEATDGQVTATTTE